MVGAGYYIGLDSLLNPCMRVWNIGKVGGQGGKYLRGTTELNWVHFDSGSGGQAGAGGNIQYSSSSKIYAFNGKTNVENQDTPFYEYNCIINGDNQTSETKVSEKVINTVLREDGKEIIPTKIFAQSGIIRETYSSNGSEYELSRIKTGGQYSVCTTESDVTCIIATYVKSIAASQYSNPLTPDLPNQGIGSRSTDV